MNITSLANRFYFRTRYKSIQRYRNSAEHIQRNVLKYLTNRASGTQWGKAHAYPSIKCYEQMEELLTLNEIQSL